MKRVLLVALLLAGCDDAQAPIPPEQGGELEQAAIDAGIIPGSSGLDLAGRFEAQSELGADRFCAVSKGDYRYDIGVVAVFGATSRCEAQGSAVEDGETIRINLRGDDGAACDFEAEFDGVEIRFPGEVPDECAALCADRASLAGVRIGLVEAGNDAAVATRGEEIEALCGG